jgi:hypothetical protein
MLFSFALLVFMSLSPGPHATMVKAKKKEIIISLIAISLKNT